MHILKCTKVGLKLSTFLNILRRQTCKSVQYFLSYSRFKSRPSFSMTLYYGTTFVYAVGRWPKSRNAPHDCIFTPILASFLHFFFLLCLRLCTLLSLNVIILLFPFCFDLFFPLSIYTCILVAPFLSTVAISVIPSSQQQPVSYNAVSEAMLFKASILSLHCISPAT